MTSSKVSWTPSLLIHGKGKKWDHALVNVTWKWRLRNRPPSFRRNLRILRDSDSPVTSLFDRASKDWLENCVFWQATNADDRYRHLVEGWRAVSKILPPRESKTRSQSIVSRRTTNLLKARAALKARPGGIPRKWSHNLDRAVARSCHNDLRDFMSKMVKAASEAEARNDKREASRIVRILRQKPPETNK